MEGDKAIVATKKHSNGFVTWFRAVKEYGTWFVSHPLIHFLILTVHGCCCVRDALQFIWPSCFPSFPRFLRNASADDIEKLAQKYSGIKNPIVASEDTRAFHLQSLDVILPDVHASSMRYIFFAPVFAQRLAFKYRLEHYIANIAPDLAPPEQQQLLSHRPVWIVGMPRTGSTFFHKCMSVLSAVRTMKAWELRYPTPTKKISTVTQAKKKVESELGFLYRNVPIMKFIHHIQVEDPDECVVGFLDCAIPDVYLWGLLDMPNAYKWYLNNSMVKQYQTYKKLLSYRIACGEQRLELDNDIASSRDETRSVLKSKSRKWLEFICNQTTSANHKEKHINDDEEDPDEPVHSHVVLKSPHHTYKLFDIHQVFEGSKFVWLHRPVAQVVGSCCSMNREALFPATYFPVSNLSLGPRVLDRLATCMHIAMKERYEIEKNFPDSFIDVYYADFTNDMEGTIQKVCQASGIQLTPNDIIALRRLDSERNSTKARGANENSKRRHKYSVEEFGLTMQDINDAFVEYLDRFPRLRETESGNGSN